MHVFIDIIGALFLTVTSAAFSYFGVDLNDPKPVERREVRRVTANDCGEIKPVKVTRADMRDLTA